MDKKDKIVLGIVGCYFVGNFIYAISERYQEKKEEARRAEQRKADFKRLSDMHDELDESFKDMHKILQELSERQQKENTARLVRCLYAIIKQRKTLMKSEEEFVVKMIRHNKMFEEELNPEKATDQEIIRYLETKCNFDIFNDIPMLTGVKKTYQFYSLKDLGIESI